MTQTLSRCIITNSEICHGQPTFRGTRILVADVLAQVASGIAWEAIVEEWRGAISQDAIREAVQLARASLVLHADEFAVERVAP